MILFATIVFFILVLFLPPFWAFGLSFLFQCTYFQNGSSDISSFGFLIVLLRLIIFNKISINKLVDRYKTLKLFSFILAVNIIWSVTLGNNAGEFILANIRMLVSTFTFAYFINEGKKLKLWLIVLSLPLALLVIHNYLLGSESHPFYESVFEFGRLSGRTITGQMLNSNQAAYIIFVLVVMIYVFLTLQEMLNKFTLRLLSTSMLVVVLFLSGFLGSRSIIFSVVFLFPMLFFSSRYVISFVIISLLLVSSINFSTVEFPLIGETANERIREIGTEEVSKESEMSRAAIFSAGWNILMDNFILGVGTGRIMETMASNQYLGKPMMLHNVYLDLAIQFGLVGMLIVFWIFYLGIRIMLLNLNLGYIYFVTVILTNLSHDFFLISITPILILLLEFYSFKTKTGNIFR